MTIIRSTAALASGLVALVFAAQAQQQAGPPPCTASGNCTVQVRVGANCAISVAPDPLAVAGRGQAKKITWEIATDGYVFASNGIAFKAASAEFDEPELDGKKFRWRDRHTTSGRYEYNVNVVRTGPNPATCSVDPVVVNE